MCKMYCSKTINVFLKLAYEKARAYTLRFETIRTNYEVDTRTDPNTIKNEKGMKRFSI